MMKSELSKRMSEGVDYEAVSLEVINELLEVNLTFHFTFIGEI